MTKLNGKFGVYAKQIENSIEETPKASEKATLQGKLIIICIDSSIDCNVLFRCIIPSLLQYLILHLHHFRYTICCLTI